MEKIRTLIVDDEAPSRARLRRLLEETSGVDVIGWCENGAQAVKFIRSESPDLVLLDIQMPGMGGFEVVQEVGAGAVPALIFVTAYEHYAPRAFEVRALDYLMKPFSRERVGQAVERAAEQIVHARGKAAARCTGDSCRPSRAGECYLDRIEVKLNRRTILLPVAEIDWIGAASNYVEIHVGKKSYLIRCKLGQLSERLDPKRFIRVHRSTIVNLERVAELMPLFNSDYALILRNGTRLVLSRTNSDKFWSALRGG